jgi:chromosome segregation ATPase
VPPPPEKETRRLKRTSEAGGPSVPAPEPTAAPSPASGFPETSSLTAVSSIPTPDTVIGAAPAALPPKAKETASIPSIPPLIRRTSPLPNPNLKPIFEYDKPVQRAASQSQPLPGRPTLTPPVSVPPPPAIETPEPEEEMFDDSPTEEKPTAPGSAPAGEKAPDDSSEEDDNSQELATAWTTVAGLNEKIARMTEERDDARNAVNLLRAQLLQADEKMQEQETGSTSAPQSEDVARAIEERDSARRDYASLREQFEIMKQEQVRLRSEPGEKTTDSNPAHREELETLRAQLAEREEEIHDLKMGLSNVGGDDDDDIEILRLELNAAQGQVIQAREEASIAQRGLGLSQKALQETRDALREASEGSSQAKSNLESLKREVSALSQQNVLLQAQHDQISRELAALKAKAAPRP